MAQIDSNIYFQQQTADPFGSFERGMKMGDMLKKQRKESDIQEAINAGIIQNPDGTVTRDASKTMSALLKGKYGQEALEFQEQENQRKLAADKLKKEKSEQDLQEITRSAWKVNDQITYDEELKYLASKGIDVSQMPKQYNPQMIENVRRQTMSVKDRIDEADKLAQRKIERDRLGLEEKKFKLEDWKAKQDKKKTAGKVGQEAVDKDYAKDYTAFTGGGRSRALDAIKKLKEYRTVLDAESKKQVQAGGGPISGSMPDAFRTQESIALRDGIISVANQGLKETFGGQLSDGERKAAATEFYNDKLNATKNISIIDRKIAELENALNDKTAQAQYFEQNNGTLAGFKSASIPARTTKDQTQNKAPVFKTTDIEWAD